MQFPESWLRSFVNPSITSIEISNSLTMAGLETDILSYTEPVTSNIIVGKIVEILKHPVTDKVNIYKIDIGEKQLLNIVSKILGIDVKSKVPVALNRSKLISQEIIKLYNLYGIKNDGIICTEYQLKSYGSHHKPLFLPKKSKLGTDVKLTLNLNDVIFVIKPTPNRSDCLSIFGISREISTITGSLLNFPKFNKTKITILDKLKVNICSSKLCGSYSGRIIKNINTLSKTPEWMFNRLKKCNKYSSSILFNIINYIMLEFGCSIHLFDLDKFYAPLIIRWGNNGEEFNLLNNKVIKINESVGVISDKLHIKSLAGISDNYNNLITSNTKNIYIMIAFWWPDSIRGISRKYNIFSDSAYRFERGVDWSKNIEYLEYATKLILDICGGNAGPIDNKILKVPKRNIIKMYLSHLYRIIGIKITSKEVSEILNRLNFNFYQKKQIFFIRPPSYRFDIKIEEDIIEEIVRIYGFEKIPLNFPISKSILSTMNEELHSIHEVRKRLISRDYIETLNFTFVSKNLELDFSFNKSQIKILNPISKKCNLMRTTLFSSLINVLILNLNRNFDRIRIFEIGRVFLESSSINSNNINVEGCKQPQMIGLLAYGPVLSKQWGSSYRRVDFFDVKNDLESLLIPNIAKFTENLHPAFHPGKSSSIIINKKIVGWIGELNPYLTQKYKIPHPPVLFEINSEAVIKNHSPKLSKISKFPHVYRDISIIVNKNITAQELIDAMNKILKKNFYNIFKKIILFDQFYIKNIINEKDFLLHEKSLSFRVILQDDNESIKYEKIDYIMKFLVNYLIQNYKIKLRK